jgi:Schlafen, AlbA_2/Methyl-accepting chemotaxis protein-like, first PDC sensor domain
MEKIRITKSHFIRDLILAFIVLSFAIIGAVAYYSAKAQRDISEKYINNAALRAVDTFQTMMEKVNSNLQLIKDWGEAGRLSLSDTKGLNGLLFPILKRDRIFYGISIADTDGENYYVADVGEGWRTSRTGTIASKKQTFRRIWNADQRLISEEQNASEYDPRQRPWFFPALDAKRVFWTKPYTFYDIKDVGITVSTAFGNSHGKKRFVVALDILLKDLFLEIQRMGPSKNSRVFIFKRDAQLYIPESKDASPDFLAVTELKDQLIQKVMASWNDHQPSYGEVFSVRHNNEIWWCGFRVLEITNRNIWVGVMVPEADITGGIKNRKMGLWSLGLFLVAVIGVLVFWLTRRYSRSFDRPKDLFDNRRPEESVRQIIAKGEGLIIEFKSTMRMNLHTGKKSKEIELAWLKAVTAFINTDGGTLLFGVTDDGQIAGMESDNFANEDKCRLHFKNLINQHIGAEFSKSIRFNIITMDNKQVGIATCSRSTEPAFLKDNKKEAFYIRSGPSSYELPVSKVVAYIQNRK